MAILLDSALISDARRAAQFGWVRGLTTNPALLAQSELTPAETLRKLAEILPGQVFYQLTAANLETMEAEAAAAADILGTRLVLKIPATQSGFQTAAQLSTSYIIAMTAVYSPAQAVVSVAAGVRYVIPYVNRAERLLGNGIGLVSAISSVLPAEVEIVAASIKTPAEAVATLQAGARHLTLPLQVLETMPVHELSQQAVEEFNRQGTGLFGALQP